MSDRVILRTAGKELTGWTDVSITAGITMAARSFTVGITYQWPQSKDVISAVKLGDPVEVWIGDDPVVSGYIFATPMSYSSDSLQVSVSGRSRTADIVDCSPAAWLGRSVSATQTGQWSAARLVPPSGTIIAPVTPQASQWKSQTIEQIAADLCGPYGIDVVRQVSTGDPISQHAIDPGETVFDSINRLLANGQLFATDDAAGRLVLTSPGAGGNAAGGLEMGVNILQGSIQRDATEVFSDYVVIGQRSGSDQAFGSASNQIMASTTDPQTERFRLLALDQSGEMTQDTCRQIASFEQRRRRALLQGVSYTVVGWRDALGKLWTPNTMVHVRDSFFGIDDDLLLAEVQYQLSDQGSTATLNLAPLAAFEAAPTLSESQTQTSSWLDEVQ